MADVVPDVLDPTLLRLVAGVLLGGILGVALQRTHYCTMGALTDFFLFGSWRRLRVWLLAMGVAVLGTQALDLLDLVAVDQSLYRARPMHVAGLLVGGVMFGLGMVLAGGCASRSLVRLASGSLKSLVVLMLLGISAYAVQGGVLAWLDLALRLPPEAWQAANGGTPSLGSVVGDIAGIRAATGGMAAALLIGLPATAAIAWRQVRAGERAELGLGLVIGLACVAGWLVTGLLAADPFDPRPPASIAFVGPVAQSVMHVMTGHGLLPGFGVALIMGMLAGAGGAALAGGSYRLEAFHDAGDMGRHVCGGLLMGVGGSLALGCTIGQGVSGISTLSLGSFLALAAIVAGCRWGLYVLEHGRLVVWPRAAARSAGLADREAG